MYEDLVKRLNAYSAKHEKHGGITAEAADAIKELEEKAQAYAETLYAYEHPWISVTERLPESRHGVLVYAGVLFPYIAVGYYDGLWKFSYNDEEIAGGADYWMPLPQPPKEGEE